MCMINEDVEVENFNPCISMLMHFSIRLRRPGEVDLTVSGRWPLANLSKPAPRCIRKVQDSALTIQNFCYPDRSRHVRQSRYLRSP